MSASDIDELLLRDLSIRSRLNALVHERAEAVKEADKLQIKAERPGGNPALAEEAARWQTIAERVAGEIEGKRAELREAETHLARAHADRAAADSGANPGAAGASA